MRNALIAAALLALVGGGAALAASGGADPIAAQDPDRPDCRGLVECPLTGETICADRCPLAEGEEAPAASCCRDR